MKRTFTLLLLAIVILYVREGYNTYHAAFHLEEKMTGKLSDIAKEVTAIPLQPANGQKIQEVRNVQWEKNNLFLISENILYRFSKEGRFICRITQPEDIEVAGYLINPIEQELIVMGNANDLFYYTFDGDLIGQKRMEGSIPNRRILSMSLHNNRILSMEENCYINPDTQEVLVEKELVAYDTSFRRIESHKLASVDLGRSRYFLNLSQPQLCVNPDTGKIFVYSPSREPEYLLQDTLLLTASWDRLMQTTWYDQSVPVVPIRPVGRFWFSSYAQAMDETENYMFCYDTKTCQHKTLMEGFEDDFYQTGIIQDLQAMDIYNQSFCFVQSGKTIKKAFPAQSGNAVVFIVSV